MVRKQNRKRSGNRKQNNRPVKFMARAIQRIPLRSKITPDPPTKNTTIDVTLKTHVKIYVADKTQLVSTGVVNKIGIITVASPSGSPGILDSFALSPETLSVLANQMYGMWLNTTSFELAVIKVQFWGPIPRNTRDSVISLSMDVGGETGSATFLDAGSLQHRPRIAVRMPMLVWHVGNDKSPIITLNPDADQVNELTDSWKIGEPVGYATFTVRFRHRYHANTLTALSVAASNSKSKST